MEGSAALPLNRLSAPMGAANSILRARSNRHFVKDFPGPLSIKSVTSGVVSWRTSGRDLVVNPDSFLVLHPGEPYSLEIDERHPIATLYVFFRPGFVESVAADIATSTLDSHPLPVTLSSHIHPRDSHILPRMHALTDVSTADPLWIDQQFVELASSLVHLSHDLSRRRRLMPARRPAVREELFRRVCRGQELLHASLASPLRLEEISRHADLSPFHFHRAFTRAFGRTPHQYRAELRLQHARRLLQNTARTVTEICGLVGFESLPSFSALFRKRFGASPTLLRSAKSKLR